MAYKYPSSNLSFSQTVTKVANDNRLKNPDAIRLGQSITLPDGTSVTVQRGDTLSGIVDKWKTNAEAQVTPTPVTQAVEPAPEGTTNPSFVEHDTPPRVDVNNLVDEKPMPIMVDTPSGSSEILNIRSNPLAAFSSSAYNISLYMINPDTYNLYSQGQNLIPSDWKLICRSGGINNGPGIATEDKAGNVLDSGSPRAAGFELDCYIDNLVIKTAISSKETMSACNSFDFTFQIHEPYGFSLPTRLVKAATKVQAASKIKRSVNESITALQTQYLLVLRFYGYDKDGTVITNNDYPMADKNVSDPSAVFERSFPLIIYGFDFKLDPKMVTYNVKAKLAGEQVAFGKSRLEIQEDMTLKGQTVRDVLQGSNDDNKKQDVVGLIQRLNEIQQRKLDNKDIEVKDVWNIKFEPNTGIENAVLVDIDKNPNEKTPNAIVNSADSINIKTSSQAKALQKLFRPVSVNRGDSILQVIEQVISQSSYITKAFKINPTEEFQQAKSSDPNVTSNGPTTKTVSWYSVIPSVTLGKFDNIRKEFSTEITYIIKKYEVPYIRGLTLGKRTPYYGPVKRYKHWFMSDDLNTQTSQHQKEIISYDVTYNLLYFNLAGTGGSNELFNTDDPAPNVQSAGGSNPQGKAPGWYDKAVGPVKTFLYSPADQLKAKIVILGDPDYLMTATSKGYQEAITKWFGTDQSINPNSGQVFIEIQFRDAIDYSPGTGNKADGLLNPSQDEDILFWKYPESIRKKVQGTIYMVWQVISTFNKGIFQQELKVCIPPFVSEDPPTKKSENAENAREIDSLLARYPAPTTGFPGVSPVSSAFASQIDNGGREA